MNIRAVNNIDLKKKKTEKRIECGTNEQRNSGGRDVAVAVGKLEYPEDPDRCATPEKRRGILSRTMDKARQDYRSRHKMPDQWTKHPPNSKKQKQQVIAKNRKSTTGNSPKNEREMQDVANLFAHIKKKYYLCSANLKYPLTF